MRLRSILSVIFVTGATLASAGMSLLQATAINVFYEIANLVRGQVTAHSTPKSWWENMQQGWIWDLDAADRMVRTQMIRRSEPVSTELPGNLAAAAGRLLQSLAAESRARAIQAVSSK